MQCTQIQYVTIPVYQYPHFLMHTVYTVLVHTILIHTIHTIHTMRRGWSLDIVWYIGVLDILEVGVYILVYGELESCVLCILCI